MINQDDIYFIVILSSFLLFPIGIVFICWINSIWYRKNYMDGVNHKCWDCKKVEMDIYYTNTFFGRIYRCLECSKKHK